MSDPGWWLAHVRTCDVCSKHYARRGCTRWLDGRVKPAHRGWYERLFTDGLFRHWWNGHYWSSTKGGAPHWRQVGSYPCWRGLTCTAFMSPSRYPVARAASKSSEP